MKATITRQLIAQLKPKNKQFEVWDTKVSGLIIRVNPSGRMNYACQYGRGRRLTIGPVSLMTPAQAREQAIDILGKAQKGENPKRANKPDQTALTLLEFIEQHYAPWVLSHNKSGKKALRAINSSFIKPFGKRLLKEITLHTIDEWRTCRLKSGMSPVSVNTNTATLSAALTKAVQWGYLPAHPLQQLKRLKVDNQAPIERFLSDEEELRLRNALDAREAEKGAARTRGNDWRQARNCTLLIELTTQPFVDDLKPMVLLSLNTGIRQNALFHLRWCEIDFQRQNITLNADIDKAGKKRCFPLNSEALEVLKMWREQTLHFDNEWVFPNPKTGKPRDNVRKAWANLLKRARIENFRWHDMRHHFASRLVMAGTDLNTVRQLLGHSDIKMTLRYAHLSPLHQAQAVEKLVRKK